MKKGVVYLIGAGPGDPGLITLKGKEILESCDALVYDCLLYTSLFYHQRYTASDHQQSKWPYLVHGA